MNGDGSVVEIRSFWRRSKRRGLVQRSKSIVVRLLKTSLEHHFDDTLVLCHRNPLHSLPPLGVGSSRQEGKVFICGVLQRTVTTKIFTTVPTTVLKWVDLCTKPSSLLSGRISVAVLVFRKVRREIETLY